MLTTCVSTKASSVIECVYRWASQETTRGATTSRTKAATAPRRSQRFLHRRRMTSARVAPRGGDLGGLFPGGGTPGSGRGCASCGLMWIKPLWYDRFTHETHCRYRGYE